MQPMNGFKRSFRIAVTTAQTGPASRCSPMITGRPAAVVGLIALVVLLQLTGSGQSRQPDVVYGPVPGGVPESCGGWTAEFRAPNSIRAQALSWWVLGYVSGAVAVLGTSDIPVARTDPDGIRGWISKYCSDHPLDSLAFAARSLVAELIARERRQ